MTWNKILLCCGLGCAMLGVVGNEVQGIVLLVADTPGSFGKSSSERFVLMMGGESVKDSTTGLIWEQSPDAFHGVWSESIAHCAEKTSRGQKGWRLPAVKELASLADPTQRDPALPHGHPFSNVKSAIFWTATPSATDDILAWHVSFLSGEVATDQKSQTRRAWCVLGDPAQ